MFNFVDRIGEIGMEQILQEHISVDSNPNAGLSACENASTGSAILGGRPERGERERGAKSDGTKLERGRGATKQ
jgi:hypothetical protein